MICCACFHFIPFDQHRPRANTYSFKCGIGGSSPDLLGPFFQLFENQPARLLVLSPDIVNEYSDFYFACGISISPMKVSISSSSFLNILYPGAFSSHFVGCPCNLAMIHSSWGVPPRRLPALSCAVYFRGKQWPSETSRRPSPTAWWECPCCGPDIGWWRNVNRWHWPCLAGQVLQPRVCNWWQLGVSAIGLCLTFPRWSQMDGSQYMCLGGVICC